MYTSVIVSSLSTNDNSILNKQTKQVVKKEHGAFKAGQSVTQLITVTALAQKRIDLDFSNDKAYIEVNKIKIKIIDEECYTQ